ncbi:MAG: DUF2948 family protein [Rhizobiaceae bacterium]
MDLLKLAALDEDDLKILSAHAQDAVLKAGDLAWLPNAKRFVLSMNRFAWEVRGSLFRRRDERRRSVLSFDRVLGVRSTGIARAKREEVLSLLAIRFAPAQAPAGNIELDFADGGTVRLDVECIEARLADVGGAWEAAGRPSHGA